MNYPAYPEYKESGVQWLGKVPGHWDVKRLSYMALLKSGDSITSEQIAEGGEYPVFGGNGLRGYYSEYTHEGTFILIGRQGALCGNINYASGRFWASEHAVVVNPLSSFAVKWLGELLYAMNLNQYSVSAAQPGLSVSQISSLRIPVPPSIEQTAIANFLDRETGWIDTLVAKKRRLVSLLKEKRTALISRTVTRGLPEAAARKFGLEPHTRFKDSGMKWLDEVPEGWEVKKLRYFASDESGTGIQIGPFGGMLTDLIYDDEGEFKVYGQENTLSGDFSKGQRWVTRDQFLALSNYHASPGDVLFTRKGSIGGCTILPMGIQQGIIDSDTIRLRVKQSLLNTSFLLYSFKFSAYLQAQVQEIKRGAILSGLNTATIANLTIIAAPLPEQTAIATHLDRETAKIDQLVAKVEAAIARLQEYRTALITAAVTGKIDVRNASNEVGSMRSAVTLSCSLVKENALTLTKMGTK